LIEQLLEAHSVKVHSVTCRVKSRESLEEKLSRPSKKYGALSDVTDLCGIRITTYFEDVVDRIATLLETEFCIDRENSVDKRSVLDPDRFGYLSLHHVVSIASPRSSLTEYRRFAGYKAEIQTRSILQHAWAEIEHDLGYKTKAGVPAQVRRRFARLAGLLELADKEFTGIRDQLEEYEHSVADRIELRPDLVAIDKVSLAAFVGNDPTVKRLDEAICARAGAELNQEPKASLESDVERISSLGIQTIEELKKLINEKAENIVDFAQEWITRSEHLLTHRRFYSGISLFYFWYIVLASSLTVDQLQEVLDSRRIIDVKTSSVLAASEVLDTYKKALSNQAKPAEGI